MPKGKKSCPICTVENSARNKVCANCQYSFFKEPKIEESIYSNQETVVENPVVETVFEKPRRFGNRNIYTPSGDCPVKPEGFKLNKWETPYTEQIVKDWAISVYNRDKYFPDAVVYFSRFYWDIHGKDYPNIYRWIMEAIDPNFDPLDIPVNSQFELSREYLKTKILEFIDKHEFCTILDIYNNFKKNGNVNEVIDELIVSGQLS